MPEVNTKLFIDDNILSDFDDKMDDSSLLNFPPLDLPQIEPDFNMPPTPITVPHITENPITSSSTILKQSPKVTPVVIKPNRKPIEKPIQPNYIIEPNTDQKIAYIQKSGTHTLVPLQSVGQIHLPADQMKQVLFINLYIFINCLKII